MQKLVTLCFGIVALSSACNSDPIEIPKNADSMFSIDQKCEAPQPSPVPSAVSTPMPKAKIKEIDEIADAANMSIIDRLLIKLLLEEGHQSAPAVVRFIEALDAENKAASKP